MVWGSRSTLHRKEPAMKLRNIGISLASVLTATAAASAITAASASAADLKLAIVYDGSKFDRSFSQSASDGVERFKKETKVPSRCCAAWRARMWI